MKERELQKAKTPPGEAGLSEAVGGLGGRATAEYGHHSPSSFHPDFVKERFGFVICGRPAASASSFVAVLRPRLLKWPDDLETTGFGGYDLASEPIRGRLKSWCSHGAQRGTRRPSEACELLTWLAAIAQPVEHVIRNDGVGGSNPSCGTTYFAIDGAVSSGPKRRGSSRPRSWNDRSRSSRPARSAWDRAGSPPQACRQ